MHCKKVTDAPDFAICMAIRMQVFVLEQGVAESEEWDGLDEGAEHFLLTDAAPVGTARLRYVDGKAKIERVAVLPSHRGKGAGSALMQCVLEHIRAQAKVSTVVLSGQTQAMRFYESLGFKSAGGEYMEAGIPHYRMELALEAA
jgi:predicted GNAT family N-acyltransferase